MIGDKKCTSTTRILTVRKEFYQQLKDSVNLQVKFIHIIRNPFDNVATMTLRAAGPGLRMKAEAEGVKVILFAILCCICYLKFTSLQFRITYYIRNDI